MHDPKNMAEMMLWNFQGCVMKSLTASAQLSGNICSKSSEPPGRMPDHPEAAMLKEAQANHEARPCAEGDTWPASFCLESFWLRRG